MRTAAQNIRKPKLLTSLRRWWVEKYRLPWTHELAQDSTIDELLTEYYEDYFEKNPGAARKALAGGDIDNFFFDDDEDPLIQKWERELQQGLTPDLEEGLSHEAKEQLDKERALSKRARVAASQLADENYTRPASDGLSGKLLGGADKAPETESEWDDFLFSAGLD